MTHGLERVLRAIIIAPQAHFVQVPAGYLGSRQRMSGDTSIDNAGLRGDMDEAVSHIESF